MAGAAALRSCPFPREQVQVLSRNVDGVLKKNGKVQPIIRDRSPSHNVGPLEASSSMRRDSRQHALFGTYSSSSSQTTSQGRIRRIWTNKVRRPEELKEESRYSKTQAISGKETTISKTRSVNNPVLPLDNGATLQETQ